MLSDGTHVGDLDILLDVTDSLSNSSPTTETDYVQSVLGPDVSFILKTGSILTESTVDDSAVLAFVLDQPDAYFVVKNAGFWALYQNVDLLTWAVIDSALLPPAMNLSSTQLEISHVTLFNGSAPPPDDDNNLGDGNDVTTDIGQAPVPTPFALLGLGLVGLTGVRKLRR
jgi:hypothetical protein